jgi:thiamine phosphate synthase YjbQ (UPF0047 family)
MSSSTQYVAIIANWIQAHIKSALIGASVTIPIKDGKLVSNNLI